MLGSLEAGSLPSSFPRESIPTDEKQLLGRGKKDTYPVFLLDKRNEVGTRPLSAHLQGLSTLA